MPNKTVNLGVLSAPGAGEWQDLSRGPLNAQISLGTATAAEVAIEFSVDRFRAIPAITLAVSGGALSDGQVFDEELSWPYGRMRVVAVTGGTVSAALTVKG